MSKKRLLTVLRILIAATIVVAGAIAAYYWQQTMPMKAVLVGTGGAMIVFNFLIAIFFINKNMK